MRRLVALLIAVAATCSFTVPSLLLLPAPALGAASVWQKTSLDGGQVHAVLVDPVNPGTVFAGTDRGLFRSTDRGSAWEQYGTGIKTGSSTTLKVFALAASPDGGRLYAGTSAGAFWSADRGATWSQGSGMLSGSGIIRYYYVIAALAVDPAHPQTVYAGDSGMMTEGRVLKSTDGGATWTTSASGISTHNVKALAVHPVRSSTVYAVVEDSLYISDDAGAGWVKTTGRMEVNASEADVLTVMVTSDTVYAGTTAGVWRSRDGGSTWSQGTGLNSSGILKYFFGIAALAADPAKSSLMYAGDSGVMTSGGVYASTDAGASWTQAGGPLTEDISAVAVDPSDPRTVYAATDGGLYRLTDVPSVSFQITASAPQGRGTVSPTAKEVAEGDTVTFSLLADAGYHLTVLSDNGVSVTGLVRNNTYVLTGITADHVITAVFEPIPIILPPVSPHILVLTIGSSTMSVDGLRTTLDTPPIIVEGRTLLPIRAVIEALEGNVSWDPAARKATVALGTHTVEIWIGSRQARVDGGYVTLDVAAMIVNSRTLLPLRFVAENLGCLVTWDPVGRTVTIEL
ncbi:MAG TPA: stalk domain-containing protein [Clostridia bacterium]|nr:stalk domain-containing protein [Clostridia bacterium]